MRNRITVILFGFLLAFVSGWLFANEYRPPRYEDLDMAVWAIMGGVGLVAAIVAGQGRG